MKILSVIGTRPQIIKHYVMSQVYKKLGIEDFVVYTGQHRDYLMSEIFFKEFGLKSPDLYLDCSSGYGERLGKIVDGVVGCGRGFDYGVVYGDCDSTLGGALGIKKLGLKLVHIESGLRCFDNEMIEERNRVLVDGISDVRFCPTMIALDNLRGVGIFSGNLNYDLFLQVKDTVKGNCYKDYTLVTFHRASSLNRIIEVVERVRKFPNVVFVCHPHTRLLLKGIDIPFELIEPVSYMEMASLIKYSDTVVSDSGGITQEAWMWGKEFVNLRSTTEWIETTGDLDLSIYGNGNSAEIIARYLNGDRPI